MSEKTIVNLEIKKINHSNIYRQFFLHPALTKQNIVSSLGLSLLTVTKNIDELLAEGLIQASGSQGHTGGRRAVTYSVVCDARTALGIDVTANHITIVAVDLTGNIIDSCRQRLPFENTPAYFEYVGSALRALVEKNHLVPSQILGVGIGLPSLVDADRRSVFFSKIINPGNTILEDFARHIPYPIQLFNDANAASFTEIWQKQDIKNAFYLMLSNNIGGSTIINGSLYSGDHQRSSEVGHITLVPGGKPCYCGQSGCSDAYLSATVLSNLTDGNLQTFFQKLQNGEPQMAEAWDTYLNYLAQTVNTVHMLLDCDIILGGYVGGYLEPYLNIFQEKAAALDTFGSSGDYLKICSYKQEAIAAGAALNFIASFIETV